MKKIIFLLSFVLITPAFAVKSTFIVRASGGSPIPATYSTTDPNSKVLTGQQNIKELCIVNGSATTIAFNVDNDNSAIAPVVDALDIYVAANDKICLTGPITRRVYIRGESSITSGFVSGFTR